MIYILIYENIRKNPSCSGRSSNWIFNLYIMSHNQKERNEYCAAIATMIMVTVIAIILVINLIYNL